MERDTAHRPVLPVEVAELLRPEGKCLIVDCTVGLGGHAEVLLLAAGDEARLIGIDLDESNLVQARRRLERFGSRVRLFQANFSQVDEVLSEAGESGADVLLADLGIASSQLDDAERGLSFQEDGPLDMRLDQSQGRTAADLVNGMRESQLADLIYEFGQERFSRRIAKAIVAARRRSRIERTGELERIVFGAIPPAARRNRRGVHPATRTFQALRIAVNDEMASLDRLLELLGEILSPGARAAIISFHSLEDGRVKRAFANLVGEGKVDLLTKKPITASPDEVNINPRSRSAKLRGIERRRA